MIITNFDDLLKAAKEQARPQRMLFVFVKTVVQKDYTEEQLAGFEAGTGGALLPQFCVDLRPDEIRDLDALVSEADQQGAAWDKLLVACMDDTPTLSGARARVDEALKLIVARVQTGGSLAGLLCLSRDGTPVLFE